MNENKYDGPERRNYFRYQIIFSPGRDARLVIGRQTFKVLDFSEGGLRFVKTENISIAQHVSGTLIHSDGKAVKFEAEVAWDLGTEVGLRYI